MSAWDWEQKLVMEICWKRRKGGAGWSGADSKGSKRRCIPNPKVTCSPSSTIRLPQLQPNRCHQPYVKSTCIQEMSDFFMLFFRVRSRRSGVGAERAQLPVGGAHQKGGKGGGRPGQSCVSRGWAGSGEKAGWKKTRNCFTQEWRKTGQRRTGAQSWAQEDDFVLVILIQYIICSVPSSLSLNTHWEQCDADFC